MQQPPLSRVVTAHTYTQHHRRLYWWRPAGSDIYCVFCKQDSKTPGSRKHNREMRQSPWGRLLHNIVLSLNHHRPCHISRPCPVDRNCLPLGLDGTRQCLQNIHARLVDGLDHGYRRKSASSFHDELRAPLSTPGSRVALTVSAKHRDLQAMPAHAGELPFNLETTQIIHLECYSGRVSNVETKIRARK